MPMSKEILSLTTAEVQAAVNQNDTILVDLRAVEAYNGWRLEGESRGGHIRGARSLPFSWTRWIDWIEVVRSKGIAPDKKVILYAYRSPDARMAAQRFLDSGYGQVWVYEHFVDEWTSDPQLPMEHLERYKHLVYPQWLKTLLDGGRPPEFEGEDFVLCHGHYQNPEDYEKGHIPGALSLDTNTLESTETWNRRHPEEIKATLENLGIRASTTVILYGRFSFPDNNDPFPGSSAGHLGSIRAAFILMYAGVRDVRILNGGIRSWEEAGYPVSQEACQVVRRGDFGLQIPARPELAVDIPEAKEILTSDDANLVSVRSWPEYIGELSGYNYIEKKGRIPGSVFGNCGTDAYHMENYRNLDHTTREYHEIAAIWEEVGVVPEKHNAFYCGTGWRGSEAWLNAWLMGWPRVSVFDGGWFEWSNDPSNPYETGLPK